MAYLKHPAPPPTTLHYPSLLPWCEWGCKSQWLCDTGIESEGTLRDRAIKINKKYKNIYMDEEL